MLGIVYMSNTKTGGTQILETGMGRMAENMLSSDTLGTAIFNVERNRGDN